MTKTRDLSTYTDEELVHMAAKGDTVCEEFVIQKYKQTVTRIANRYFIAGAERDDIVQEGMIGLFKAMRDFDASKSASFRTFAELCVSRQIMTAVSAANSKKHAALNTSVSLNDPTTQNASGRQGTLEDTLADDADREPELHLLLNDLVDIITGQGTGIFSEFELLVLKAYIGGKSADDIAAENNRAKKAVNNALQRARRKVAAYLSD